MDAKNAMKKRAGTVLVVVAAQSLAVALGWIWGFEWYPHEIYDWKLLAWLLEWKVTGRAAIVAFLCEWLRLLALRGCRLRATRTASPWVSLALAVYAGCIMLNEPFIDYSGDISFITGVLLITPFMLAISVLVRQRAGIGVAGAVVFFATCLSLLLVNGRNWGGASIGFFFREAL
jgi:hypothetical protein